MIKYSTSREKMSQINQQLDRQLEKVANSNRHSINSKKDKQDFRFIPKNQDNKKSSSLQKPVIFDHNYPEVEISKKNKLSQLQRKLQQLQRKMDNLSVSSDEEEKPTNVMKNQLNFKEKTQNNTLNEDTARFLVSVASENREKERKEYRLPYPTLQNQEDQDEQEDSQDYSEIQKAIQKRKKQQIQRHIKIKDKIHQVQTKRQRISFQNKPKPENTDRKGYTQPQNVLKPKYSNEKRNRGSKERHSNDKKTLKESVTSKKSTQKGEKKIQRASSKGSLQNPNNSLRKSRERNASRDKAFDNLSEKNDEYNFHSDEMQLVKDLKRIGNVEKELVHYKRLVKKYKEQIQGYRVMEIQFKEMKKNFAKSQLIRTQQKKIIQNLKHKIGSK